ncbi:MAG: FAD:protein FMN transferase [Gemmatimonadetes bacterium]|nr:FAD:protein FMN transferase [Gemmatimonadota bacterium]
MTDQTLPRPFGRREFLALGTGAFALAALPIALRRHVSVARRTVPVMGTIAELTVVHRDEAVAQGALEAALAELRWVETTMTRFSPTSDIGRANLGAAREGVVVSAETAKLVERALRWSSAAAGRFDPALGAASELWDVTNRHEPPPADQVARYANRSFWRHVDLSVGSGQGVLRYTDADVHVDLGGIGKGYSIDRAVQALRDRGIEHAIVNLGGDLYALGESPEGGAWRVGIKSPDDERQVARTFEVSNRAVATSGDYERFFRYRGTRYHHLMDPETAAPRRTNVRSVTVLADRCVDAEPCAVSTFGLSQDRALAFARTQLAGAEVITIA